MVAIGNRDFPAELVALSADRDARQDSIHRAALWRFMVSVMWGGSPDPRATPR